MKSKNLKEQLSRIKSMMKRINENEFESPKNNVETFFVDETDTTHGTYKFYYTIKDDNDDIIGDYDGTITMAPINSRMDDEIEWGTETPENWEEAESQITDRFYEWLHSRKKRHENLY